MNFWLTRFLAVALLMGLSASPAAAACNAAPGPAVDWSGCDKTKLDLSGSDLHSARFQ